MKGDNEIPQRHERGMAIVFDLGIRDGKLIVTLHQSNKLHSQR